jgi:hypothetical protein
MNSTVPSGASAITRLCCKPIIDRTPLPDVSALSSSDLIFVFQ